MAALAALLAACSPSSAPEPPPLAPRVRLAVLVVVDQMRADYLERYRSRFRGGFARLLEDGTVYTQARHGHARTETSPGHATLATGVHPARHGILDNRWYDRQGDKPVRPCDGAPPGSDPGAPGCSPRLLLRETVGDWLKAASPASKVYAVALKARSSTLLGGRHPDGAFWYWNEGGRFVTSSWYPAGTPPWLEGFNRGREVESRLAAGWSCAEDARARGETGPGTAVDLEERGLESTPQGDLLVLDLARRLVAEEGLGTDAAPDLLLLGCSAGDAIGHNLDPRGPEMEDYYRELDEALGRFLEFLDARLGPRGYALLLTSDHGVVDPPDPGPYGLRRIPRSRFEKDVVAAVDAVRETISLGTFPVGLMSSGGIYLRPAGEAYPEELRARLRKALAAELAKLPYVAEVYTAERLAAGEPDPDPWSRSYRRSWRQDRGPDLMLRYREGWLVGWDGPGSDHGSPYDYDTHVPLLLHGPGLAAGPDGRPTLTVDVAPTLAVLVGVTPPADLDGRSLVEGP